MVNVDYSLNPAGHWVLISCCRPAGSVINAIIAGLIYFGSNNRSVAQFNKQ